MSTYKVVFSDIDGTLLTSEMPFLNLFQMKA